MKKKIKKRIVRAPLKLATLDSFLTGKGKLEEFQAVAIKEVLAWQPGEAMKKNKRQRAATIVGRKLRLEFV